MLVTWRTRIAALVVILGLAAGLGLVSRFALFPSARLPHDAIRVPRDAATLEEALRRVVPGGTIALDGRNGPYIGPIDINVPEITIRSYSRPARIVGQGAAPALTVRANGVVLRGLAVSGDSVGLLVLSDRCQVEDLSFRNTPTAIRLSGAGVPKVRRVDIEGGAVGIEITSASGASIAKASLRDLSAVGIRQSASWGSTLEDIEMARAPIGVLVEGSSRDTILRGFKLEACAESGLVVRDSTTVTASGGVVRDAEVGVHLDRATGCEVRNTVIDRAATSAILVSQSLRNALRGNTIRAPRETGIRLVESSQNAITDNAIRGGTTSISLQASDSSLVASNSIRAAAIGVHIEDAASGLILRNAIAAQEAGMILTASTGCRILQNHIAGGAFGVAVTSSTETIVLRNVSQGQSEAGFALLGNTRGVFLRQNSAAQSRIGILAATSYEASLLDNRVERNQTGVLLFRCGAGMRLEGNHIEGNTVGLRQTDSNADLPQNLGLLGGISAEAPLSIGPILANNLFRDNRALDVQNTAQSPVRAAGNRWGRTDSDAARTARVSPGVALKQSAWKGTIAVGTGASDVNDILGGILKVALSSAGYDIVDLVGVADSALARDALVAGDIDVTAGPSGDPAPRITEFALPARQGWTAVVSKGVAATLAEPSLSEFSLHFTEQTQSFILVVPESYGATALVALRAAYRLAEQVRAVVWAKSLEEAESLLALGAAQFALLPSLEETKSSAGFVALTDDRGAVPSAAMAITAGTAFLSEHPDVAELLSRIAPHLTSSAIHGLVAQARLLQRSPESLASEFLAKENLLAN